jgi:hypothetical protein
MWWFVVEYPFFMQPLMLLFSFVELYGDNVLRLPPPVPRGNTI